MLTPMSKRRVACVVLILAAAAWPGCRCRFGEGSAEIATNSEALASKIDKPKQLVVDGSHVYWTYWGLGMGGDRSKNGAVQRIAKSGGAPEAFAPAQGHPMGLALDDTTVYWANQGDDTVMKLAKAGGTPAVLATVPKVRLVAVDASGVYVSTGDGGIHAVPLAGGSPKRLGGTGSMAADVAADIALDATNVYWVDWSGRIWAMPKSGGEPKALAKGNKPEDEDKSVLALDAANVYFATSKDVLSVPKAGGATKTLASRGSQVSGLAVDGTDLLVLDGEDLARVPIAGGTPVKIAQTSHSGLLAFDPTHAYWCEGMMDVDLVRRATR